MLFEMSARLVAIGIKHLRAAFDVNLAASRALRLRSRFLSLALGGTSRRFAAFSRRFPRTVTLQ